MHGRLPLREDGAVVATGARALSGRQLRPVAVRTGTELNYKKGVAERVYARFAINTTIVVTSPGLKVRAN